MKILGLIILSYLMGSISGSLLLGKFKNIDIRTLGSGNAGGTNALRTIGPLFAFGTIIIDIFKGFIPVYFLVNFVDSNIEFIQILFGISAVLGHVFPLYYGFKGGKGAGTLIGVVLAIFPQSILWIFLVWILILIFTGYVGLSTICAGIALVIITIIHPEQTIFSPFGYFTIVISLFLIYTHRENILRMFSGTENQFKKIMIFKNFFPPKNS